MSKVATPLKPRKSPVQARSAATVEALHAATIQVLTREGLARCTTTRVAERAGMSVGSLYQYYPNRDALLAAVLERHLDGIAGAMEGACQASAGEPVARMASTLVAVFLREKLRDPQESKALYAVAAERGGQQLATRAHRRVVTAIAAMLETAPDVRFEDPAATAVMSASALVGPVRAVLEGQAPAGFEACLERELTRLLTAYLQAHRG
ncbi:TetR/AcrR family transcriptional regulator [Sorangium sp. So ce1036]|uniref:TetR/AcrR family transcriptional regulator n=1 Tax=Sorangium sp. So ce1036 TaxID=3133328 RepID=UPI003F032204